MLYSTELCGTFILMYRSEQTISVKRTTKEYFINKYVEAKNDMDYIISIIFKSEIIK